MQLVTNSMSGMAGLVENKNIKGLDVYMSSSTMTSLVYKLPSHLIYGVEVASFVMEATRTGGAGFPLLCCGFASTLSVVKKGVERAGLMTIVYRRDSTGRCSEVEVGKWLRRRSRGEEQRILIADQYVSRGWEASHVLVVDLFAWIWHEDGVLLCS